MTGLNLGMVIEIVVALLLVLTIAYCIVLNRRLTRLRADEEVLRATIAELITATEIAERAIFGLKATAADCDKTIGSRLSAADGMIAELDRRLALGDDVLRRLVAASRAGEMAAEASARPAHETPHRDADYRETRYREAAYREPPRAEPAYRERAPEPAYAAAPVRPTPPQGYGFAMAPASAPAPAYGSADAYGYPPPAAPYGSYPEPARAAQPPPAREPVARSLQVAAEAAAERLSAYRRAQREEAA